ncbi:MAG: DegT/DnrJ/EryC1/StrS family aminotransferase [Candidatus Eremiobacteraeota bacterium]|nr:DegT/DnrJ/EryC1/StrS family aminotransferase [Candidatus Eremiobacteraeota bacterium]MBC5802391.1 DegT/DnrJ/EryC1/StrS family aminotransferase [Candidatus Eremiobacteraeota bacterium]MBC5820609.1 DegT/DnrJ/EryC1/StrS family aminotransferase [Candidatus Eremiobacteraeota bacterium]
MIQTPVVVPLVAPQVTEAEIAAATAVLRSGQLAGGPQVAAFEREFADSVGVGHAVAVNSGTAANHAALDAFGVGDGDEVLVTPFTFAASATPIVMQRAVPRFVDIEPRTYNLDPAAAAAACGGRTRAAVLVDLFGLPFEPNGVAALDARGVRVLEDACQAIGASRNGRMAGSLGAAGSFSFYATKNIMTGEGGMLVTDDAATAVRARRFRHHGQGAQYEYLSLGYNYRMTDITAAIGRVQLARLETLTAARRANAAFYDAALGDLEGVAVPFVPTGVEHAYHQYSLLIDPGRTGNGADRDAVRAALAERGVASGVYYPKPLHLHPLFAAYGYGPGDFPVAERIAGQILALPIGPHLDRAQLEWTVRSVRAAVGAAET